MVQDQEELIQAVHQSVAPIIEEPCGYVMTPSLLLMALDTLPSLRVFCTWREAQKIHELSFDDVEEITGIGKMVLAEGQSKCGRPVHVVREKVKYHGNAWDLCVKHFAYHMEMVSRVAAKVSPDGKMIGIIDFTDWTLLPSTPLKVTSAVMKILQTYYPELLHKCIWWHAPAAFNAVWAVVKPFVDSVTAAKIVLLAKSDKTSQEQLNATLDTNGFDDSLGGTVTDMYNHAAYKSRFQALERQRASELEAFTAASLSEPGR